MLECSYVSRALSYPGTACPFCFRSCFRDRLMTQLIELTIYALTLLGPSEGVTTSLRSARSTPTAHRGNALCACRLGKVDNSSKVACDRASPGSPDGGDL